MERGLRAGGVDWIPVPGDGLAAHALRQVFGPHGPGHPLAELGKCRWRPFEVEARGDGLAVPTLKDVGGHAVHVRRWDMPARPSIRDLMPPAVVAEKGGYYPPRRTA